MKNLNVVKVMVIGATGKMGKEVIKMVLNTEDFRLVALIDTEDKLDEIKKEYPNIYVNSDISDAIINSNPNVAVDFTHPSVVYENATEVIKNKVCAVIGTTGLSPEELNQLKLLSEQEKVGVLVAPNFAIGAVLMMELSKKVARYISNVEIIEMHNPFKADSPSGTALKTAEFINEGLTKKPQIYDNSEARGKIFNNIPIHSIRLPGVIAHQEVIFGAQGQTLTIRHDSYDRTSFMPGVALAIRKIIEHNGLIVGLEKIFD